jgi:hypothetical protein
LTVFSDAQGGARPEPARFGFRDGIIAKEEMPDRAAELYPLQNFAAATDAYPLRPHQHIGASEECRPTRPEASKKFPRIYWSAQN